MSLKFYKKGLLYKTVGLGRIDANLFPESVYVIYFFVLIQKSNKKNQSRLRRDEKKLKFTALR